MRREVSATAIEDVRKRFFADPFGVFPEVELSDLLDQKVISSIDPVLDNPGDCALLAAGGYGRRTLHPASDLDFLILFRSAVDRRVVRTVLDQLGHPGFEVGYQCRSLDQFSDFEASEVHGYTAFFEARRLCGDETLADQFTTHTLPAFVDSNRAAFLAALAEARDARRLRDGQGIEAEEPNVKTGLGGLRDYHHVLWLSCIMRARPPATATRAAVLLHRVRNFLHYLSGRNENVLRSQYQAEIARRLEFGEAGDLMTAYRNRTAEILRALADLETSAVGWQVGNRRLRGRDSLSARRRYQARDSPRPADKMRAKIISLFVLVPGRQCGTHSARTGECWCWRRSESG